MKAGVEFFSFKPGFEQKRSSNDLDRIPEKMEKPNPGHMLKKHTLRFSISEILKFGEKVDLLNSKTFIKKENLQENQDKNSPKILSLLDQEELDSDSQSSSSSNSNSKALHESVLEELFEDKKTSLDCFKSNEKFEVNKPENSCEILSNFSESGINYISPIFPMASMPPLQNPLLGEFC